MKLVVAKCPSCGAKIKVDKNSDKAKCDYCDSNIIVDDAIAKYKVEISGNVEVSNIPKLDNYIELANRYYNDKEYDEAYNQYSKIIELCPDSYVAIVRRGICKSYCSTFNVNPIMNGMKNVYKLLQNDKEKNKDLINKYIKECNDAVFSLVKSITKKYNESLLSQEEVVEFITQLDSCLDVYEHLNLIITEDKILKIEVLNNIINLLNYILKPKRYIKDKNTNYNKSQFYYLRFEKEYISSINNKKSKYLEELSIYDQSSMQAINYDSSISLSKVLLILSFFTVLLIVISISVIFSMKFFPLFSIIILISCIPKIKKIILKKYKIAKKYIIIFYIVMAILTWLSFVLELPKPFENSWISADGQTIILKNGKITIKDTDNKTFGNYRYSKESNNIYIISSSDELNNKSSYKYEFINNRKTLCLYKDNKCIKDYVLKTNIWAEDCTPLQDFDYKLRNDEIYIDEYNGYSSKIRICDTYKINDKEYKVTKFTGGVFTFKDTYSIVLPDNLNSIESYTFNSSDVKYLYIPSSLSENDNYPFYNYLHDVELIYYGGTEEQWKNLVKNNSVDAKQIIYNSKKEALN